ncbi:putative ubiquitin-conjugating enzyme E2 23 [Leucoagaricus sp. SymC.cos]|nr:putative ubiquitin-conjugating enzyme E2 23 [Leucoagaricus sp. SymC.cos]
MPTKDRKRPSTQLYPQDIVQSTSPPYTYGIVDRCWWDTEEDLQPAELQALHHSFVPPIHRPLKAGEFGVSFIAERVQREIRKDSELRLVDRNLRTGDLCKRSTDDVRSGVVVNARVKGRVSHAISGEPIPGWKTKADFKETDQPEVGEYVTYDDWIGQVVEVFDEALVDDSTNNQVVKISEMASGMYVGERGPDLMPTAPLSNLVNNVMSAVFGGGRAMDTVLEIQHTVYAIAWLAVNQSLDPAEAAKRQRPKRFWAGKELCKVTMFPIHSDMEIQVGCRVRLKDTTGLPVTQHGVEGGECGVVTVNMYQVIETETELDILWQDGVTETVLARGVVPQLNPDEYECWPGDYAVWKAEGVSNNVIVQSVNAVDRTANVLLLDTGAIELVSLLELDRGDTDPQMAHAQNVTDTLGVQRGDLVLVHRPGTTNGCAKLRVPRIGELEPWLREVPENGHQLTWRRQMAELGAEVTKSRGPSVQPLEFQKITPGDEKYLWFGEVTMLNKDGTVVVTHPESTKRTYHIERLTILYDGLETLHEEIDFQDSNTHEQADDAEDLWTMEDGEWCQVSTLGDEDGWEDDDRDEDDVDMDVDANHTINGNDAADLDAMDIDFNPGPSSLSKEYVFKEIVNHAGSSTGMMAPANGDVKTKMKTEELPWKKFDILSSTPMDHAFYSHPPAQPGKSFMARLNREYRVLTNSLPDTIVVRAFEDRTDLLRCLIIGPENTPYEDAPFIIDWRLDSSFPNSPPIAHFLSWTNGNGRVNPNLYEEGKVCLSILGTWQGDRNETWSAQRSSLLQAFVSIQGLVLVKEPWFCEPGYEKLRGTEEGTINSRLYSEKAYVLARGFVRRALEIPLGGLEEEIKLFYYGQGRLRKVLDESMALIEKSKRDPNPSKEELEVEGSADVAISRLTTGGIILLERTLNKLQGFLDAHTSKD